MSKRTSVRMANGSAAANGVTPSYLLTDKVALVTGSGTYLENHTGPLSTPSRTGPRPSGGGSAADEPLLAVSHTPP
jgi:hypothetical protein